MSCFNFIIFLPDFHFSELPSETQQLSNISNDEALMLDKSQVFVPYEIGKRPRVITGQNFNTGVFLLDILNTKS